MACCTGRKGSGMGEMTAVYQCDGCGVTGVKLWREYQTFSPQLLCVDCAAGNQHKDISTMNLDGMRIGEHGVPTDQIGWYVPAVPSGDGNYWGYTSVSDAGVQWWKRLPLRANALHAESGSAGEGQDG